MIITQVTQDDLTKCAQLVKALKIAKFNDLGTQDLIALTQTITWVGELARLVGTGYQKEVSIPPSPSILKPAPAAKKSAKLTTPQTKKKK